MIFLDENYSITNEDILNEASTFQKLQKYKKNLTPEERAIVKERKAEWSDGRSAVWKSVSPDGKVTFVTHTHRVYNTASSVEGACTRFTKFVKSTA